MWCNIYVVSRKLATYNIKNKILKMLTCFGMIWNYNKFSRQNTKSSKVCALSKIHISPNLIIKNHDITINTIYKKFQNISFENSSWGKHFFGKKDPKKDNSPKCKINTLDRYMSFGPTSRPSWAFICCHKEKLYIKRWDFLINSTLSFC
jgi:hypothetical protein